MTIPITWRFLLLDDFPITWRFLLLDDSFSLLRDVVRISEVSQPKRPYPEAGKIVNLHFPWIYIFAKIYISNLRKLKGKCKFYIFLKNLVFR